MGSRKYDEKIAHATYGKFSQRNESIKGMKNRNKGGRAEKEKDGRGGKGREREKESNKRFLINNACYIMLKNVFNRA